MTQSNFFQCEKGVAAVEFAMIVPVLLLILVGTVDYGMFINSKMKLQDLSRSAAQYVVQGGSNDDVMKDIIQASDFYTKSQAAGQTITVTTEQVCECANGNSVECGSTCGSNDYLRNYYIATLESTYSPIIPGFNSITLQGYSRIQYNP